MYNYYTEIELREKFCDECLCKHCGDDNIDTRIIDVLIILNNKLNDVYEGPHVRAASDSHSGVFKMIEVTSGYRCTVHNTRVGGVPDSYHTKGLAADVILSEAAIACGATFSVLADVGADLLNDGYIGGLGVYEVSQFIHIDLRKNTLSFEGE